MSLRDFQLLDDTSNETSNIKRDHVEIFHKQGAQLNDSSDGTDLLFGEIRNYHQIGKGYSEFDKTLRKNNGNFKNVVDVIVDELIGLVNYAFSIISVMQRSLLRIQKKIEKNKMVRHVSTITRPLTS